ncbi:unnamed protein product [Phyllotreta striolata]|uniref:Uncharacterized protein n=1 Tax=Phyllotreta striolata TaxID=444603 RepID=A0A9N9TTH7_PHYSR|nr:unnamed protein product [Phyllotreta striolata]
MNNFLLALCVLTLMAIAVSSTPTVLEENVKLLNSIDLDSVLKNKRILKNYIDCVIGTKPCTKEGSALKESWKDGLDKGCEECSEEEQRKVNKIVKHIYVNEPDWYKLLINNFDKDGKYQERYDAYIQKVVSDPTL